MDFGRRRHILFITKLPLFYSFSISLFSLCALLGTISAKNLQNVTDIRSLLERRVDSYTQGKPKIPEAAACSLERFPSSGGRRGCQNGPGSSPPRCTSKCGKCTPCRPVHVPVPPGTRRQTTEYYPEAWRCKCGNKLYMP